MERMIYAIVGSASAALLVLYAIQGVHSATRREDNPGYWRRAMRDAHGQRAVAGQRVQSPPPVVEVIDGGFHQGR